MQLLHKAKQVKLSSAENFTFTTNLSTARRCSRLCKFNVDARSIRVKTVESPPRPLGVTPGSDIGEANPCIKFQLIHGVLNSIAGDQFANSLVRSTFAKQVCR